MIDLYPGDLLLIDPNTDIDINRVQHHTGLVISVDRLGVWVKWSPVLVEDSVCGTHYEPVKERDFKNYSREDFDRTFCFTSCGKLVNMDGTVIRLLARS